MAAKACQSRRTNDRIQTRVGDKLPLLGHPIIRPFRPASYGVIITPKSLKLPNSPFWHPYCITPVAGHANLSPTGGASGSARLTKHRDDTFYVFIGGYVYVSDNLHSVWRPSWPSEPHRDVVSGQRIPRKSRQATEVDSSAAAATAAMAAASAACSVATTVPQAAMARTAAAATTAVAIVIATAPMKRTREITRTTMIITARSRRARDGSPVARRSSRDPFDVYERDRDGRHAVETASQPTTTETRITSATIEKKDKDMKKDEQQRQG